MLISTLSFDRYVWMQQICFATCFDPSILADLQAKEGKLLQLTISSTDVSYWYPFLKSCFC